MPDKLRTKVRRLFGTETPLKQPEEPKALVPVIPDDVPTAEPIKQKIVEEKVMSQDDDEDVFENEEEQEGEDGEEPEEGSEGEEPEEGSEGEEPEVTEPKDAEPVERGEGDSQQYMVKKLLKKPQMRKDGSTYRKSVFSVLETYVGVVPLKPDIEASVVPLYGGGVYMVIDGKTKKLVKKYEFEGEPMDPDQDDALVAPPPSGVVSGTDLAAQVASAVSGAPLAPVPLTPIDKVSMALASGQSRAVEQLAKLAEKFAETGDAEQLGIVMNSLKEIATGKKETTMQDKLMEMMTADRTLLLESVLKGRGKETSQTDVVRETIGTMKDMFSMARDMMPGDDTSVQMARELGGIVQNSMKDVTDTIVTVTGSKGDLTDEEEPTEPTYRCERCKNIVQPTWKVCPNCGLVFKAGLKAAPEAPPATEVFDKPAMPIPPEIKGKLGYLRKLAVMIKQKHDPVKKGSAFFNAASADERLMLLFTAEFGYANLMRLAKPYKDSPEIAEGEAIFKIIESGNGKLWIEKLFRSIREAAKEDRVSLTPALRAKFLMQLNDYSPVKFAMKAGAKTTIPGEKTGLLTQEKVEQVADEAEVPDEASETSQEPKKTKKPGMAICPVCDAEVSVTELKDHLFTEHPRKPTTAKKPTGVHPLAKGAASLSTLTEPKEAAWKDPDDDQEDGTE